jgi:origin recognition complex subunit 1
MKSTEAWLRSPSKQRKVGRKDDDDDGNLGESNSFYCHLVVDSMRGLHYDFDWDQHHHAALTSVLEPPPTDAVDMQWGSGSMWAVDIADKPSFTRGGHQSKSGKPPRKKVKLVTVNESESEGHGTEDEYEASSEEEQERVDDILQDDGGEESDSSPISFSDDEPKTPSKKKRKRDTSGTRSPTKRGTTTPRKSRTTKTLVHPTPHSKARRKNTVSSSPRKRRFAVRPQTLTYAAHDLSHLPRDPWLRAMHVLHVGSRPDALPCRDEEFERVLRCVGELLEEGSGGCVCMFPSALFVKSISFLIVPDISGVPGTGKTATVHAIVRELKRMAEDNVGISLTLYFIF